MWVRDISDKDVRKFVRTAGLRDFNESGDKRRNKASRYWRRVAGWGEEGKVGGFWVGTHPIIGVKRINGVASIEGGTGGDMPLGEIKDTSGKEVR
jgi:hypothetical protein